MVDNLKGKPLDYKQEGAAPTPQPTPQPTPTPQPSGSVDAKLVGAWTSADGINIYTFNADGTFFMIRTSSGIATRIEGDFTTSNGKIYLTNIIFKYTYENPLNDKESEYSFGNDQYGDYVMLKYFSFNDNNPDSSVTYKYYK
jgi:hypothetical protein